MYRRYGWARSDASRASTLQRSLPESERCGGLTESVRHGSRARGSRSAFCFSYARPAREIRSETSTITPEPTAPTIRSGLFRRSDPMPEQRRPDTPEPTDDRRRGGPGREIELRFSGSGSVVGMVSLCHTDEWRTRDRIGPRLIRIISLYRVRGSRAPDLFRISLGGSGEDDEGGVEERRLSSRGGTLREVVGRVRPRSGSVARCLRRAALLFRPPRPPLAPPNGARLLDPLPAYSKPSVSSLGSFGGVSLARRPTGGHH